MKKEDAYCFNENVRMFVDTKNEIRLRIGIWNYDEAVLNLHGLKEDLSNGIREIFARMIKGEAVTFNDIQSMNISNESAEDILQILNNLRAAGMVCLENDKLSKEQICYALLGNLDLYTRNNSNNESKPLLFFTDSPYATENAKELVERMDLKLNFMSEDLKDDISNSNLTKKINGLETEKNLERYAAIFKNYTGIIGCLRQPLINFLRNINRIIVEIEMPMILSFIDGPFISMIGVNPPNTGCFECFEQRSLARMEDHIGYNNFLNFSTFNHCNETKGIIPLLNILTNLVLSEGFLLSTIGTSKFMGRALNIHIPTLEIQIQDILRVPFCPACGAIAKSVFEETNISTRVIIDDLISKALGR
ncbi:streptolysin associated protein SagC [Aceticella autotrophica]|uniref:Streptolysin associated protein SagC n=1 Tax=Aceticella autotrophica TaxID=2755338 RepID=A0A975AVH1_9THEO|nr:hypothetical protein [Aceticella autotrophica]QSZ27194.1 streptolysin associated protein SagC [Aceticella autotrophica]